MDIPRKAFSGPVLAAVDFSDLSVEAWALAQAWSSKLGAPLEGVYAHQPFFQPDAALHMPPLTDDDLKRLAADLREKLGSGARLTIREGFPTDAILERAEELRAGLLVAGTHGRRGLELAVYGSTAAGLVRRSPAPVLIARGGLLDTRRILVPVNFTRYALEGMLEAAKLAARLGAGLDVLYVATPIYSPTMLEQAFEEALKLLPPFFKSRPPQLLLRRGDPAARIVEAAAHYDLVVLAVHPKQPLRDWVFGTTVEQVLRRAGVPVLALPPVPAAAGAPGRSFLPPATRI